MCGESAPSRDLRRGVSLETSAVELATAAAAIAAAHPELYPARGGNSDTPFVMTALPLRELLTRSSRPVMLLLAGAVGLLLLDRMRQHRAVPCWRGAVERRPELRSVPRLAPAAPV